MHAKKRRTWPVLTRTRTVPPDGKTRADMIRALTDAIEATCRHVLAPNGWRDRRRIRALEHLINQRGEILELLAADQPACWSALCTELALTPGTSKGDTP